MFSGLAAVAFLAHHHTGKRVVMDRSTAYLQQLVLSALTLLDDLTYLPRNDLAFARWKDDTQLPPTPSSPLSLACIFRSGRVTRPLGVLGRVAAPALGGQGVQGIVGADSGGPFVRQVPLHGRVHF